ncbi:amino acid adenylation domain-containing protein [Streptomyces sp. NBRC 109706]|uniref:amino acid adenylation domain-containing protein n=1 Tax=Streptomyces sp. NBRC 109706 TaxID=1550035 RepID=UPI000A690A44|nr:amino acid adenylation domain-containing protein [Streptomyces sp. NBRC 109706]
MSSRTTPAHDPTTDPTADPPRAFPGHAGPVVPIAARTVLELLDRAFAAHPDALAVVEPERITTYRELDRLADLAAGVLRTRFGVGRGDTVLVAARAGRAFTAVVLGVLRSGAAYLPVDLDYPAERIATLCRASSATLVVTAEPRERLVAAAEQTVADQLLTGDPGPAERPELDGDDPAYLIFSSGSTGVPKGIVQSHRCLVNLVSWQVHASGLGRGRQVLQFAPLTFDVSVQEVFSTLASGGCLVVPGRTARQDPRELVRFVVDEAVEVVDLPQSLIDVIMELPTNFAHAPALRHIISAGEPVRVTPGLRALLESRPELTLHNHYGPAENHMVTSHVMSSALGNLEPEPPVGSLVWNTYLYLLDERRRPVPDGEEGEVYIGGVGVGRYTDPELTRAAFGDDPFRPGNRLYRTRDRGVWQPDGTLRLLGRIDDLIKIRGHAVEPREVEEGLRRCPGVADAAAFGAQRDDGSLELHAVLVGDPPVAVEIRRFLLTTLPDYLVPVRWWVCEKLPTGPNGKLDRKSLPGPGARPLAILGYQEKPSL